MANNSSAVSSDHDEVQQEIEDQRDNITELRKRFTEENPHDDFDSAYDPRDIEWMKTSDPYLYQVLVISKNNLDTAMEKLNRILRWRKVFGVNDIRFEDFPEDLRQKGALYSHATDKKGRRILWYFIKHYQKTPENQIQAMKMTVYWMNKLQKEDPAHRIVILEDMTGAGISNMDIEMVKFNIQCYELYFPALVGMLYMFDMPWILNTVWKVVEKFLSQQAKEHIKFIRGKEVLTYIDESSLPAHMGGTDPYVWEYNGDLDEEEDEERDERDGDVSFRSMDGDAERPLLLPLSTAARSRQNKQQKRVHFPDDIDGKENVDPENSTHHKKHRRHSHKKNKIKEIHVGPHISIRPGEVLIFEPPTSISGSEGTCSHLNIINVTDKNVVYKVKTTTPERYKVRPSMGPINPGSSISISIKLLSGSGEVVVRDKFLILSSDPGDTSFKSTSDLSAFWKNVEAENIVEHRLSCVYRPFKPATEDVSSAPETIKSVLTKLQGLEDQVGELRRQNSRLVWLQLLIFLLSAAVLIYLVFYRPDEGALLAHNHSMHAAQCAPCADLTEKVLRGAREGL